MSENKKLTTQVSSKMDLTVNKDDVLVVLLAEQEEKYTTQIETLQDEISKCDTEMSNIKDRLRKLIGKKYNVPEDSFNPIQGAESARGAYNDNGQYYKDQGYHITKPYNIHRLENLKRPQLSKDKFYMAYTVPGKLTEHVTASKNVTTEDGFSGRVDKLFSVKPTKTMEDLLKQYNEWLFKQADLEAKITKVQYDLLILDTDKTIKARFLKKIVKSTNLSKLLLE
jgi:hypothetical protein